MIRLFVGLGNPGAQYEKTRHNAGFLFLDLLAQKRSCAWSNKPDFQGLLAEFTYQGNKVLLLKPQAFYNCSGQAVGKVARYYKIVPEEILVVHDELDFEAGVLKLRQGGGHAGNNGLKDIIAHLGSREFYRLRIGIGKPMIGAKGADYVLSPPSAQDRQQIASAIDRGLAEIDQILVGDIALAMNRMNTV
jgi:PTH1 family peptidyl-tRNA hydrolase